MKTPLLNVVLVEPEIPNNTGNIGRTCVGSQSRLHLIEPLGFEISDKQVKRSGLDYWPNLDFKMHRNWQEFCQKETSPRKWYFTTKTTRPLYEVKFEPGDYFVFGRETRGLDEALIKNNDAWALTIPMYGPIRSYNLANSVAVAMYEALRQFDQNGWLSKK